MNWVVFGAFGFYSEVISAYQNDSLFNQVFSGFKRQAYVFVGEFFLSEEFGVFGFEKNLCVFEFDFYFFDISKSDEG